MFLPVNTLLKWVSTEEIVLLKTVERFNGLSILKCNCSMLWATQTAVSIHLCFIGEEAGISRTSISKPAWQTNLMATDTTRESDVSVKWVKWSLISFDLDTLFLSFLVTIFLSLLIISGFLILSLICPKFLLYASYYYSSLVFFLIIYLLLFFFSSNLTLVPPPYLDSLNCIHFQ